MSEHVNGEIKTDTVPPPSSAESGLDVDDVNGRLQELTELNAALMTRCASLRGQLAKLMKELTALRQ